MHRLQKTRGLGSQRNRKENQDTPIQDFSLTGPANGCWRSTKNDERKINSFRCQYLRRILRIRWQQRMTNKRVVELAEINGISCEVRRRRWNWLGHILRREGDNVCFTALGWTPEGRRTRGRPKKLLGEGQWRKSETQLSGRAGKQPKRLHKIESVGRKRLDDDDETLTLAGQKSQM